MNFLSLLSIIVLLIYLELGVYVFYKNMSAKLNRSFFYLCIGLAIWSLSYVYLYSIEYTEEVYLWFKIGAIGWCLTPAFMIRFKMYLTNIPKNQNLKEILFFIFLIPGTFFLYLIFAENWIFIDLDEFSRSGNFVFDRTSMYLYSFLAYTYTFTALAFFILIRWFLKSNEKNEKNQFKIIFTSLALSLLWVTIIEIALPLLQDKHFYLTTHIAALIYIGGLAYSMLRYRLFLLTPDLVAGKVVNELPVIMFFTDMKSKVLRINSYTEKLLGINGAKIYGKQLKSLFKEESLLEQQMDLVLKNQNSDPLHLSLRSSMETIIPVKLFLVVIKDEFDDILGYVAHGYDDRENVKLEKQIENRKYIEYKLENIGGVLQQLVRDRTNELEKSYKNLQVKVADSLRVEEQVKADISEKEILINEIHDRVISNMHMIISLINTQTPHNLSMKTYRKFRELNQRVKSMLLVQDNLYLSINYSDVDFANFLNTIIDNLLETYNEEEKILVKKNISEFFLDIDCAIPLGLVVNELITNVLLHAFPGSFLKKNNLVKPTLYINYFFDNQYYYLIVSDNGKGLPNRFNMDKLKTTGLPLVDILVNDQINGSWSITSDHGTFVKIVFRSEK